MPIITASSIISKVRTLLQDTTSVRWTDAELLGWLNDGQRAICTLRPDACTSLASAPLVAGTRQSIPATATAIIKVIRNMGANGSTPGPAIRKIPMELLDSTTPNWHAATPVAVVQHFMTDPRMPRNFYVYPPSNGTTQVELLCAAPPTDVATLAGVITVDDNFSVPLIDYVAYRAYMKDNDLIGNSERADKHLALYNAYMTGRAQGDGAVNASKDNVAG